MTIGAEPARGEGIDLALDLALVGTTGLDDGRVQMTYNGFMLFYFSGDTAPGAKNGLGVVGRLSL